MAMDQRRMDREDELYEQKQRVERQERRKERVGARLTGILASGLSTEQMYQQIQALQEEFKNTDLAGTDAGRGMFGAYGMFGRRAQQYSLDYYKSLGLSPEQSQEALQRKHLGAEGTSYPGKMSDEEAQMAEFMDAKRKAEDADDTLKVSLINEKLSQMPRYKQLLDRVHGPTRDAWLSEMEDGGFSEFVDTALRQTIKGKWGTSDKRYGPKAYADALKKAVADGYSLGLSAEKITAAFNRWWDKEHKKNTGRWQTYADRSQFSPQETAEDLGYDPGNVQTVAPAKGWTDEQYGDELMGMYGDILGGPKARPPSTRTISPPAVAGRRPPQAPHPALNKVWPTMSDEQKKQAVQARSLGWTWEQIAEAIGRGK